MIWLALFIGCIFGANWAIATFGFVPVGFGLMAPAGVYFAGLTFTFRDLAHESVGRRWVIVAIVIEPAGTPWTDLWCAKHDEERRARITASLTKMSDDLKTARAALAKWEASHAK